MKTSVRSDEAIALELLARVRLLSLDQLGRVVSPDAVNPVRAGERCARRLERARLVCRTAVVARPPAPARWLGSYVLGGPKPDFGALSRELRRRAEGSALALLGAVRLAPAGARLFGVRVPRAPRRSEVTHDLQLAEVAVTLARRTGGHAFVSWLSEEDLLRTKAYRGVIPDAEVAFASGARFVVEGGGSYSRAKLEAFHAALVPQLRARGVDGYHIV